MLRVVMLVNKFPPLPAGGAEKQAKRLAEYLNSRGVTVGVVTRGAPGLPAYEQYLDLWIERLPQPGIGKLKALSFALGAIVTLWQRRKDYDILHAHLASAPALVAAMMGRLLRKAVIVKYGTSGPYGDVMVSRRSWLGRLKLRILCAWVDVHVALDAASQDELLSARFPKERVLRMLNGIDSSVFRPIADKTAAKASLGLAGRVVVAFAGRLVPQKSLPGLLVALRHAVSRCPELHLLLIGDGTERPALERHARELQLMSSVTFTGHVEDIHAYLNAADIFVLPSAGEGISNALLEAMAAGLACIATTVGGSPDVLDAGACGILVPPDHPGQLGDTLVRLAERPDEMARLGRLARQRVVSQYDFSVTGDQYLSLYRRLVAAASGQRPVADRVYGS